MNNVPEFNWYTEKIKQLNEQIWYPMNTIINDTIVHPFNSKIISFESFINTNQDEKLIIKQFTTKPNNQVKNELSERYGNKVIELVNQLSEETKRYLEFTSTFEKSMLYFNIKGKINQINENEKLNSKTKKLLIKEIAQKKLNQTDKNYHVPIQLSDKTNIIIAKICGLNKNIIKHTRMVGLSLHSYKTKIPFNNDQKNILNKWLIESELVYNKCVDCYNSKDPKFPSNFMTGKKYIFELLFNEKNKMRTPYDILTYEVKCFFDNLKSCYANLANGNINNFEMKYKNNRNYQTITIPKTGISKYGIYKTFLNKIPEFTNIIKANNVECDCKLTYDKTTNNFYLYVPQYKSNSVTKNRKPICAIDPGEKVPFTYYSLDDYGLIGNDIRVPILKIERKIRNYQRILSKEITKGGKKVTDNKKEKIISKINLLYKKIKGIVNELHKKTALYLCRNYDTILIPSFETQKMVCDKIATRTKVHENCNKIKNENSSNIHKLKEQLKKYKRQRRLNSRVKFVLNQLSHYKFRQHLLSKAKEYGCQCIVVTEEYTSQLCTVCGNLDKQYNNRIKKCTHCKSTINRDVNGSRNILLKNISNHLS